jgi:hypothetical protein
MSLSEIAARISETLEQAGEVADAREAQLVEHSSAKMAHHIVAYVLERADVGADPHGLGQTMVQGAVIGEDESGGMLAEPVINFLESLLDGAKAAIVERYGNDPLPPQDDPVAHAAQYMLLHNRWPDGCPPSVIARAKAALAAGQRGSGGNKNAALGTFL